MEDHKATLNEASFSFMELHPTRIDIGRDIPIIGAGLNAHLSELDHPKIEVLVATVMIGIAERVLNVPDRIKPMYKNFKSKILLRLSSGDSSL